MAWFKKEQKPLQADTRRDIPEGVWVKCDGCAEIIYQKELDKNFMVCPACRYHFKIPAHRYVELLTDLHTFEEKDSNLTSKDPLEFKDSKRYPDRIRAAQEKSGLNDAAVCGMGKIDGRPVSLAVMDFGFIGGSMGSVVGEKVARLAERAMDERCPLVIFCSSGGARMQEGILSLMQMAKTSAALARLKEKGFPYISVLTDPTTGGVSASFAMLGDVILAEPKAIIGFAGQRVIEQTIKQKLPEGFQRSEYLLEHGMIDLIVERKEMKKTLGRLLAMLPKTQEQAG